MYCISRQLRFGFASNVRATKPAASGAEAEVPTINGIMKNQGRGTELKKKKSFVSHNFLVIVGKGFRAICKIISEFFGSN